MTSLLAMCECLKCGAFAICGDPSCTESECNQCRDEREGWDAQPEDPEPEEQTLAEDGQGRR
jgi:hypothetical protein